MQICCIYDSIIYNKYYQFYILDNNHDFNSGTTATVCLLRNNVELVVGWVGDSRALMCRSGKVVRLMHDHKPRDPVERKRIEQAGGVISEPTGGPQRVAGKLDMTRSIGDVELKAIGVTAEPDTRSIEVSDIISSVLASLFQRGGPRHCESGPLRCTAGRHTVFWTAWWVKIIQYYV